MPASRRPHKPGFGCREPGSEVRVDRLTFPHSRGDLGGGRRLSGVKTGVREDEVMMMVTMGIVATILVSLAAVTATPGTGSGAK